MSLSGAYEHKVMDEFKNAGWLTMRYASSGKHCPDFEAKKVHGLQSYYIEVKSTAKNQVRLSTGRLREQYDRYRRYLNNRAMKVYYVVYWKGNQPGRKHSAIDFYTPHYDEKGYPLLRPFESDRETLRAGCVPLREIL